MLALQILEGDYAVARLPPEAPVPDWAANAPFLSITRTMRELSIVAPEGSVPNDVRAERGWRCFELDGPIPFEVTGVAASLTAPLAAAAISVFLVSTFDTDYLLVKKVSLDRAVDALRLAGLRVTV